MVIIYDYKWFCVAIGFNQATNNVVYEKISLQTLIESLKCLAKWRWMAESVPRHMVLCMSVDI